MSSMSDLPNYLPGIPPLYGYKQAAPEFAQGCDVVVEFPLEYGGEPLTDLSDWVVTVYIKKSLKAEIVLWRGPVEHKIAKIYFFKIPATDTIDTVPGTYYYAVKGIKGVGEASVTLKEGIFAVVLNASSPTPKQNLGSAETTEPDGIQFV